MKGLIWVDRDGSSRVNRLDEENRDDCRALRRKVERHADGIIKR